MRDCLKSLLGSEISLASEGSKNQEDLVANRPVVAVNQMTNKAMIKMPAVVQAKIQALKTMVPMTTKTIRITTKITNKIIKEEHRNHRHRSVIMRWWIRARPLSKRRSLKPTSQIPS